MLRISRCSTIVARFASTKTGGKSKKGAEVGKYSHTVKLPTTSFSQRANSIQREPELQQWWKDKNIHALLAASNSGEKFIIHDGPPYANGDLHIGHALNKILKDIFNKYQTLKGKKVYYVPGWDCHGLPIESKVLQSISSKERASLSSSELRHKAASFAEETVKSQMNCFKRFGVWGDWDNSYLTMKPYFEAEQVRVFGEMVQKGFIYRGKKPVHWSPSSTTALAEAELEYPEGHVSKSIYVCLDVCSPSVSLDTLTKKCLTKTETPVVKLAIWTTTPWTIPSNLAVAVHASIEYALVECRHAGAVDAAQYYIVATDLVDSFSTMMNKAALKDSGADSGDGDGEVDVTVRGTLLGRELADTKYQHPLYATRQCPVVIGGEYITTASGTGLVHTAPGHGVEDYHTGLKYNLDLLSPVDDKGAFTAEAGERFEGLNVLGDGNDAVIAALKEFNALLALDIYPHKYPYDWRTKKPTIMRATEQWFTSVSSFRDDALTAVRGVQWVPETGENRISSMIKNRGDWCISRQRSWGVPIPVFYKIADRHSQQRVPLITADTLSHIEDVFRKHGTSAWWDMSVEELLPAELRTHAEEYERGWDTMDVWFDSGTSWAGVLQPGKLNNPASSHLAYPADLYLEGSDQHRGWFQSSLLTSVACNGIAPYKTVLTHGFVLDEKGHKMSKSIGNVVDPDIIVKGGANKKENPSYGADTLRLWAASVDYKSDVCVGNTIIKQIFESNRKLRNTIRFILGNLQDTDKNGQMFQPVPYEDLYSLDKYILGILSKHVVEIESAYEKFELGTVYTAVMSLMNIDLSVFYLDVCKDRLYVEGEDSHRRRSCQTVLKVLLEQISVLVAPILPHLAEDIWQHIPYHKPTESIFQLGWIPDSTSSRFPEHEVELWRQLRTLRSDVNKCIELARRDKVVGSSADCQVYLHTKDETLAKQLLEWSSGGLTVKDYKSGQSITNTVDDLRCIFLVSQVTVMMDKDGDVLVRETCPQYHLDTADVTVGVAPASGGRCERCWNYCEAVTGISSDGSLSDVCNRCAEVLVTDKHV